MVCAGSISVKGIDDLRATLTRTQETLKHANFTVRFFASVIKSGERWSVTCQEALDKARSLEAALAVPPETDQSERNADGTRRDNYGLASPVRKKGTVKIEIGNLHDGSTRQLAKN